MNQMRSRGSVKDTGRRCHDRLRTTNRDRHLIVPIFEEAYRVRIGLMLLVAWGRGSV